MLKKTSAATFEDGPPEKCARFFEIFIIILIVIFNQILQLGVWWRGLRILSGFTRALRSSVFHPLDCPSVHRGGGPRVSPPPALPLPPHPRRTGRSQRV